MIIGIDGNEANVVEKVGVSFYTLKLLEHFQKKDDRDLQFIVFLKSKPSNDLPRPNAHFTYSIISGNFLWSQTFLPLELYKRKAFGQNIQVFFSPAHYVPRFCPIPVVVTIHDLSYFYYPDEFLKKDLYQLKNWTEYSIKKARTVIAVSNTTKKDIVKFYHTPDEKIDVVYNGGPPRHSERSEKSLNRFKLTQQKYILFVGTLQPRKNVDVLLESFTLFRKGTPGFKLVLVGKKGWLYEHIFKRVEDLGLKKDVIFTGYLKDDQVSMLYKKAFCFVMPSLYEGFGIPLLESMSHGCPVISSFASSLPEIGGNACLYFDPKDPQELLEKLVILKNNQELRKDLIQKGKERTKLFSWQKCADQTLQVLRNSHSAE